jgi:catechol 2,3-dioxygenase-like lactoylglutathione lyase family enzyme
VTHGLLHATAIAGPARRNLDFYTRVLGLVRSQADVTITRAWFDTAVAQADAQA